MPASVTQNLKVRVCPVNNPHENNLFGEQQGYYHAYVSNDEYQIEVAQREWLRGIVHSGAGYGAAGVASTAVEIAVKDYIDKFGALCIADTKEVTACSAGQ